MAGVLIMQSGHAPSGRDTGFRTVNITASLILRRSYVYAACLGLQGRMYVGNSPGTHGASVGGAPVALLGAHKQD
jgi:hypothetical protein